MGPGHPAHPHHAHHKQVRVGIGLLYLCDSVMKRRKVLCSHYDIDHLLRVYLFQLYDDCGQNKAEQHFENNKTIPVNKKRIVPESPPKLVPGVRGSRLHREGLLAEASSSSRFDRAILNEFFLTDQFTRALA